MESGEQRIIRLQHPVSSTVAQMMLRAYADDPLMEYVMPSSRRSGRLALWFLKTALEYGVLYGEVYAAGDLSGIAIWLPPHHREMGLWGLFRTGMLFAPFRLGRNAFGRLLNVVEFTHEVHRELFDTPHWYLFELAVDPGRQRTGIGGALIAPVLARADIEGIACYVETFTEQAKRFYQRNGFAAVRIEKPPKGGPECTFMIREPR